MPVRSKRWQRDRMVTGQFVDLGGGEDEFDVRRRLFERLEQGVEGADRQHVDFVDDVDLEAAAAGPILHVAAQVADLFDAVVAGAVDFEDVDILAGGDAATGVADAAGFRCRAVDAVEGLGEDAGGRGLADAARAGEEVGVGDAVAFQGVREGLGGGFLADEVGEGLRTVASGEDGVAGRGRGDRSFRGLRPGHECDPLGLPGAPTKPWLLLPISPLTRECQLLSRFVVRGPIPPTANYTQADDHSYI